MKLDITNVEFYLKIYLKLNSKDIEFYTELDFVKIEIQNKGILLNSLESVVFCYIVLKLKVFTYFGLFNSFELWSREGEVYYFDAVDFFNLGDIWSSGDEPMSYLPKRSRLYLDHRFF